MALHRATQSAIWYYLSCTPCAESRYRKKLKEKSERDRIEREAMYTMMPHAYRHPSPSGTNPHWLTEIENGPHMISRGKKKPNPSDTRGRPRTSITQHSNASNGVNSLDLSSSNGSRDGRNDSKFDFKRYQRDDEQPDGPVPMREVNLDASYQSNRIARPPRARIRPSDAETSYTNYRNPQLNDLHPATVTKFNSREETRFMLKALPDPDFMKGKDLATGRSRSDSGNSSRLSVRSPVPLSREVSHKIIDRKIKAGEDSLASGVSLENPSQTAQDSVGQPHERVVKDEKDFAEIESQDKNVKQTRISDNSSNSAATVVHRPEMAPEPLRPTRKVASKPQLSTILSDSVAPSGENDLSTDDSLKILRELAPSSAIFNTAVVSTDDLLKAPKNTSRRLPSHASEDRNPDFDPEVLESWDSTDFALPEWIHEHTKREVKQRWSMEL